MKYSLALFLLLAACRSTPDKTAVAMPSPPAPPTEEHVTGSPAPTTAIAQTPAPSGAVVAPVPKASPKFDGNSAAAPVKTAAQVWKLTKGKLSGPGAFGFTNILSKSKNKKGNGTTTETCHRFATYSVVELRSSDEVGSAELTVRHEPPRGFNLCQPEFRGKTSSLRIIEGYFAGVGGGLIMVDGADSTEGQTEFQLFAADSGLEIFKGYHHPTEDFTITRNGEETTVDFYAKLPVKCELANEGQKCWERVLRENKVVGKTPMPDCAAAFAKSNTPLTEPVLVFTRARLVKGSVRYLGGHSTCQPAP